MASKLCYQESDVSPDPRHEEVDLSNQQANSEDEESKIQTSVKKFLELNKVTKEWCNVILENTDIKIALYNSIDNLSRLTDYEHVPTEKANILKALTFCDPEDIKVIILGHEPIPRPKLATGLAFSLPSHSIDTDMSGRYLPGESVKEIHKVIAKVNNLEEDTFYDTNHEDWAKEGVLLLNAALTINAEPNEKVQYTEHFQIWQEFISKLLSHLLKFHITTKKKLFVLCWGTNAKVIAINFSGIGGIYFLDFDNVASKDMSAAAADQSIVYVGHHPTYPQENSNKFHEQAFEQFQEIKKVFPELFSLKAEKDVSEDGPKESCRTVQEQTKIDDEEKGAEEGDEDNEDRKENIYRKSPQKRKPSGAVEADDIRNVEPFKQRKPN